MKVAVINQDRGYTAKNGITYYNYYVTLAVKKTINGIEGSEFVRCTFMDQAVRSLLEAGKIKQYKDLEGKELKYVGRSFPTYLDKFEKQNGVIKYDTVIL